MTVAWDEKPTANQAAVIALHLNDSNESALGPGVFLDTRVDWLLQPAYEPDVRVLVDRFTVQSRLGDVGYLKRFGVMLFGLHNVSPGVVYQVIWTTDPGEALQDNASWELDEGRTCGFAWCTWVTKRCDVTEEPWGVGVIEHGAVLSYAEPWRCYAWSFLPLVVRR